ncbi:helix-turn-helix transcriptional regulator [Sulfurovum sp. CS9]|uniref:helix-turn-helix transcriptional regulator n=1 Tax=Sulfurovum sp. CS9 TaxID=3391146 RepID=UPI0039E86284
MSTVLFPAGLKIDFRDVNMEMMAFYARAWNLKRIQMQKGSYLGSVTATHTPRIQLMRTPHSHGLLIQGDFPKGTVLIAFLTTSADVNFHNKLADKHEIKILKSGDEIDFLCNGKSETFTIAVQEQFFYEAYYAYFGQDFNNHSKNKSTYVDPLSFPQFIRGIEDWISYLIQDHTLLKIQKQYESIELEILEHIFSSIYVENSKKLRQKFQIKKARDLLHQSIDTPINISKLTKELNISERLLHHAFKKNYGITPKKYLLNLRMNSVKQDLLLADPTTTIASVIQKYNFYNQSTFTQAYKEMFGELPSDISKKSL